MPKPAGSEVEDFCRDSPVIDLREVATESRDSVGLRQGDDNAELPSTGPERDGAEVPALAETNFGRPKAQERLLDMFS